ncbi:hypothetical protein [Arthrobacter sp. UYCu712]
MPARPAGAHASAYAARSVSDAAGAFTVAVIARADRQSSTAGG